MKKFVFLLIGFLFFYSGLFAQEFQISESTSHYFSIDRFTNDVYWQYLYTGEIYRTNLNTMETELTDYEIEALPVFANKTHMAAYIENGDIFIHNFDIDSSWMIIEGDYSSLYRGFSFSPNDISLRVYDKYYNLKEENIYTKQAYNNVSERGFAWNSDSTAIYLFEFDKKYICEYNYLRDRLDTLKSNNNVWVDWIDIDYDIDSRTLIYSVFGGDDGSANASLFLWNLNTNETELIYDQYRDLVSTPCAQTYYQFTYPKFSLDSRKIAFFGYPVTLNASGVYTNFLDSAYTHLYTICDAWGVKRDIQWLNNDTIIYVDNTRKRIYGFDITSPITTIKDEQLVVSKEISFSNYPNPFNNFTNFLITSPYKGTGEIHIYNILGERIGSPITAKIVIGEQTIPFIHNSKKKSVASGIYFAQFDLVSDSNEKFSKTIKILLTK